MSSEVECSTFLAARLPVSFIAGSKVFVPAFEEGPDWTRLELAKGAQVTSGCRVVREESEEAHHQPTGIPRICDGTEAGRYA
jgi:hypothetical protein